MRCDFRSLVMAGSLFAALVTPLSASALLPVVDVANLRENAVSALQNAASVTKQIAQYETQLSQYQNEVTQLAAPFTSIYGLATNDIKGIQTDMNGVNQLVGGMSVSSWLSKIGNPGPNVDYCKTQGLCSEADLYASAAAGVTSMQNRDAALVQGTENQNAKLLALAQTLETVSHSCADPSGTSGTTGTVAVGSCANQIAAVNASATIQLAQLTALQMQRDAADKLLRAQGTYQVDAAYGAHLASLTTPTGGGDAMDDMSSYGSGLAGYP